MKRMSASTSLAERLRPYFAKKPEVWAAYLFGSAALGAAGPLSDVDVAVLREPLADRTAAWEVRARYAAELGQHLGRPVDVVRRATPSPRRTFERGSSSTRRTATGTGPSGPRASCAASTSAPSASSPREAWLPRSGGTPVVRRAILYKRIAGVREHLARVATRRGLSLGQFLQDLDSQDVILHNLQLAIRGCIDVGVHVIADEGWGVPGSYAEVFHLLRKRGVLDPELAQSMTRAAGFRNILVHDYLDVDLPTAYAVCTQGVGDLEAFLGRIVEHFRL